MKATAEWNFKEGYILEKSEIKVEKNDENFQIFILSNVTTTFKIWSQKCQFFNDHEYDIFWNKCFSKYMTFVFEKWTWKLYFSLPSNFVLMNSTKNFGGYGVFFVNQLEGNDTLRNKENVVKC